MNYEILRNLKEAFVGQYNYYPSISLEVFKIPVIPPPPVRITAAQAEYRAKPRGAQAKININ
jgi:hypothetical protein